MPKTATRSAPVAAIEPTKPYTYAQVAQFMEVSPRQIRRWIEEGHGLGYVQLPQGRRVFGQQLLDFIERRSVNPEV